MPLLVEAQAAPERRLVAGLFHGDFFEEGPELRIVGLLGQGQVALPGLHLMGDGQFDGLNNIQLGFGLKVGLLGCHIFLGGVLRIDLHTAAQVNRNYITIFL